MKKYVIFTLTFLCSVNTFAGIFGPKNYDECLLKKMKGQVWQLLDRVRTLCEKEFPYEKDITYTARKYLKWSWNFRRPPHYQESIELVISKNPTDYNITELHVEIKECGDDSGYYILKKNQKNSKKGYEVFTSLASSTSSKACKMTVDSVYGKLKT